MFGISVNNLTMAAAAVRHHRLPGFPITPNLPEIEKAKKLI
jgi:hypothetical protein